MKKLTNYTPGPRGVTLKSGEVVWIKPGATVEFEDEKGKDTEIVSRPDLGSKPAAEADADADALAAAQTENDALKTKLDAAAKEIEALKKAAKP